MSVTSETPQTSKALQEWRDDLAINLCLNKEGNNQLGIDLEAVCGTVAPADNGFTIDGQFYYGDPVYWLQQYLDASLSKRLSHFVGRAQTL